MPQVSAWTQRERLEHEVDVYRLAHRHNPTHPVSRIFRGNTCIVLVMLPGSPEWLLLGRHEDFSAVRTGVLVATDVAEMVLSEVQNLVRQGAPPMRSAKKPRARKMTSDKVATNASNLLAHARRGAKFYASVRRRGTIVFFDLTKDVEAVAGSALGQDEKRGK